ncbi:REP-associated tyrosine transposase [Roseobacteraceae bacterium S113]
MLRQSLSMPSYRRFRVPGGTYFLTLCLADRTSSLLIDEIDVLREAYLAAQISAPFTCDAMVVLPDHLHALWTMPQGDCNYSRRVASLKTEFTRRLRRAGFIPPHPGRKGESGIWQPRFWEHTIRDQVDFDRCRAYCWANPVKHGLADRPIDWPYSTFRRDEARCNIPDDWNRPPADGVWGEAIPGGMNPALPPLPRLHAAALAGAAGG